MRMKIKTTVIGLAFVLVLAGCSSNDANVAACTEANTKLFNSRASMSELVGQDNQVSVLASMAGIFTVLSGDFTRLAGSASGDVSDELNSAANAASEVSDAVTSLDDAATTEKMNALKAIVSENGTLDMACQAVGSEAFSTGW